MKYLDGVQRTSSKGLIARARDILFSPGSEWPLVEVEPATVKSLTGYILVLAAIGPIAEFVHVVAYGYHFWGVDCRPSIYTALMQSILLFGGTLVMTYAISWIVNAVAPIFRGERNMVQAVKLAAYAATAAEVANILDLLPGPLYSAIPALYSVYLFYRGLPVMMKSSPARSRLYCLAVIVPSGLLFTIIQHGEAAVLGVNPLAPLTHANSPAFCS